MLRSFVSIRLVPLALLAGACLTGTACRSDDHETPPPPTAAHAVHGEMLAEVMRQLESLDRKLMPQELDTENEQLRRLERVTELATALESSADTIPDVLDDVALTEEQNNEFIGLAEVLESRAGALAAAARSGKSDELRSRLDQLHASCDDCHQRFRVLPEIR